MATDVTIRAWGTDPAAVLGPVVEGALDLFGAVEAACTRFVDESPLSRANASPMESHQVPELCFKALAEALGFHRRTGGRFDPRVLRDLLHLGYDRSLPFADGAVSVAGLPAPPRPALAPWNPRLVSERREVVLGALPVDLGGIGKGLAVRWASAALRRRTEGHLVEAGGDCYCAGTAPDGTPWRVAVEDPGGASVPRAVLELEDTACATSSVRLRRWQVGDRSVHHLIDPASGRPGGDGLAAVTVVAPDPAGAEVWAKVLFLAGADGIEAAATEQQLCALWVGTDGALSMTGPMERFVCWGPW